MPDNYSMQAALDKVQAQHRLLYDLNYAELQDCVCKCGAGKFRAQQIQSWLNKGVVSFAEMLNIPKQLTAALAKDYTLDYPKQLMVKVSQIDGSRKYLFQMSDGNIIEAVYMPYKKSNSVCISSQAGCRMGCAFCASTLIKYGRNLSAGEMMGQIYRIQRDLGEIRIDHVVVMGIGEPLENLQELLRFLRMLNAKEGLNISLRHVTVSTCGLVPAIYKLAEAKLPITLAISLHSALQAKRESIMPIAKTFDLRTLKQACITYQKLSGRRLSFEYALFKGFNDSIEDANYLADYIKGIVSHVNLIPVNPVPGTDFVPPSAETVEKFKQILLKRKIEVTVRQKKGQDIFAACGQLRRQKLQSDVRKDSCAASSERIKI